MSSWRYILASLRQYRRVHLAVAAGVAVATAVITGALLIGDSMRGSLRGLALESLGRIDVVVLAEHPFREALVDEWLAAPQIKSRGASGTPLILSQGSAVFRETSGDVRRATQLQVIGAPPEFWLLAARRGAAPVEQGNKIALTETIAEELGVKVGDPLLLRLPVSSSVPADSTLGEKEETSASRLLEVAAILAEDDDSSFARFSLRPNQQAPRNVFVPLETLQDLLELDGQVNAIAIAAGDADEQALKRGLRPELIDYGIKVERVALREHDQHPYLRISADRLVLPPHVVSVARELYVDEGLQPVVTYLANRIVAGKRQIPYSTVAGVDSTPLPGPVFDEDGKPVRLADDEVALNDWAAEQLDVAVGDSVDLAWYEPETTHGELREPPPLTLKVRAIVPLADEQGKPTAAADPNFAPELPGVTDQASIDDWDLPFELVEEVRDEDEAYWNEHRTTPKAFVSFDLASDLWQTRWGNESVLRLPAASGRTVESVTDTLRDRLDPAKLGMLLLPVKRNALTAAAGTTPFDGLFLGFSFFLMASAVMLTTLLFRLGIEQRAAEVGLLLSVGTPPRRVRWLLMAEAAVVAGIGAAIGAFVGIGYARLMVHGLNTWWVDATATPFLELHVTSRSIVVGFATGLLVALATIAWSLRRLARLPARQLLSGDAQPSLASSRTSFWSRALLPAVCVLSAVGLGVAAAGWEGEAQAGAFFGGGALVLIGVLLTIRGKLRETTRRGPSSLSLAGLAARNARRNPSRTMLALALSASASFLIVALSAFRLAPSDRGVGGFDLLATADLPVLYDLATADGRRQLGFSDEDNAKLADATIIGFRMREGEDASCLNLYKPSQPRILGAPNSLSDKSEFAWSAVSELVPAPSPLRGGLGRGARSDGSSTTPRTPPLIPPRQGEGNRRGDRGWLALNLPIGDDAAGRSVVPMVLDRNTATYSLKLGMDDRMEVVAGSQRATLEVAGLLANSVLQGDVIISEQNFLTLFPEEAGQRFFLIRSGESATPAEIGAILEAQLEDFGFDIVDARQRLGELLAVQNTYLSTFQSLGALGLLLGVVGLAVVQLRSVLERRGELALMQATGFRRRRLAMMVLAENLVLLLGGLGIGCLAALAAVLPHAIVEQAGTPWATLALLLGIVAAAGAAAAWAASRVVLRAPLLPALRGD
jgi:ABC-type antimicrobial peptide transport system permease subunit